MNARAGRGEGLFIPTRLLLVCSTDKPNMVKVSGSECAGGWGKRRKTNIYIYKNQ